MNDGDIWVIFSRIEPGTDQLTQTATGAPLRVKEQMPSWFHVTRARSSLSPLIKILQAVQLKVVDCRPVWKFYSNTVLWAFFLAVATHQTSILIDHHHLRFVLIETKAGDGTGVDTSPTLRAGRLIQFDA